MKKSFCISAIIIVSFISTTFSQSDVLKLEKNKEITVSIGMASTKIKNANLSSDYNIKIDNKNGIDFSFEFSKYFFNRIGLGFGLGCSTFNQEYSQKGLFQKFSQVDKDGYTYDKWISSDISYTNKLMYFNIPIKLHLILGNSPRYYGFVDAGIINQFLINGVYTEVGSTESMAKYSSSNPYWSDLTQNNSYYDLKFKPVSKKDAEKYKFYNLSGHFSIGFAAGITDKLFLRVAPFVNIGSSDIMGPDGKDKDYENVFGDKSEYKPTKLFSSGINVGFSFNL